MRSRPTTGAAPGQIEIITGGMFSGKSEELVRRLRRALIAKQNILVFKPSTDTRHEPVRLVTRDNRELDAVSVPDSASMARHIGDDVDVVGIDEAQFFDNGLVEMVTDLADQGMRVVVAGLDLDYLRRPFGPLPALLSIAEHVDKMHAVCVQCGDEAHYSQRIAGGDEQVEVGDTERYEARCRRCYVPYHS